LAEKSPVSEEIGKHRIFTGSTAALTEILPMLP